MKALSRIAISTILALAVGGVAAHAAVTLQEDFQGGTEGVVHGQDSTMALGRGEKGWSSPQGGNVAQGVDYIEYAVGDVFPNPSQGTVEFYIRRGEQQNVETPFALMDAGGSRIFAFRIWWSGTLVSEEYPEISFHKAYDSNLWYTRFENSRFGKPAYDMAGVSFGKKVAFGQWVHLAMTWGGSGQNALYVDGKKLNAVAHEPNSLPDLIGRSAKLVVGAEGWEKNPDGAYGLTTSVIRDFRVHDTVLSPEQFAIEVNISTVQHDAFSRAGYSGKLVAGESFTVTMVADPGCVASFDVVQPASTSGGVTIPEKTKVASVSLTENPERPGIYTGTYTVGYGDEAENGQVVGRLAHPAGIEADPLTASSPISIDGHVHFIVKADSDLIPADRSSRSGLTVTATDANGRKIRDHRLSLTLSTTDEYTGIVGGSSFEDAVGGSLDVAWGGVTDSFGEVTAQLVSGFAAKTMVVSAKDMVTGDVGVGWVRSYITGTVEIVVKPARTSALSFAGSMEISASREWLTADGRSRSRITAVVKDAAGVPMEGHVISFSLVGTNGSVRVIQSRTDSRGRAFADYIAGVKMGQVTIEVRDMTGGLFGSIAIELRPDAPAKIALTADPAEVFIGGEGSTVAAEVLDINDNPNRNVDVVYDISVGEGSLSAPSVATDEKGKASVRFTPGDVPGTVTVRGTVTSRAPAAEEVSAAEGAVFLYGLPEDPGVLDVTGWLVEAGDEVVEGQELATLTDRAGVVYTVKAPRDGEVSVFAAEEGDEVEYGDTLGYVLLVEEK